MKTILIIALLCLNLIFLQAEEKSAVKWRVLRLHVIEEHCSVLNLYLFFEQYKCRPATIEEFGRALDSKAKESLTYDVIFLGSSERVGGELNFKLWSRKSFLASIYGNGKEEFTLTPAAGIFPRGLAVAVVFEGYSL